jgi:20S proteasome alpha/beta subunit
MTLSLVKKDFVIDKIDGETTIFDVDRSIFYSFNPSGSYIFAMIKKGFDENKIAKMLSKKYGISEKQAEKDVSDFLKNLSKNKIISSSK